MSLFPSVLFQKELYHKKTFAYQKSPHFFPQSDKGEDIGRGVPVLAFRRSGVQETEDDTETKRQKNLSLGTQDRQRAEEHDNPDLAKKSKGAKKSIASIYHSAIR